MCLRMLATFSFSYGIESYFLWRVRPPDSGLQSLWKLLLEFLDLGPDHDLAIGLGRIVSVVFLVVILRDEEFSRRFQSRDHWMRPLVGSVQFIDGLLCLTPLVI